MSTHGLDSLRPGDVIGLGEALHAVLAVRPGEVEIPPYGWVPVGVLAKHHWRLVLNEDQRRGLNAATVAAQLGGATC